MVKFKSGDRVDCRVKWNNIVNPYAADYEEVITFEIISNDEFGYYLFVPCYRIIKDSVTVNSILAKREGINKRFIGEQAIYIQESLIFKISSVLDGLFCACCSDFFDMAESNQPDGTLICFSCRSNPFRKYR